MKIYKYINNAGGTLKENTIIAINVLYIIVDACKLYNI